MKKIFITLSIALFAMLQSACELERIDYSEIFEEDFFLTTEDVEYNINSLYSYFGPSSGVFVGSTVSYQRCLTAHLNNSVNYTQQVENGYWTWSMQMAWDASYISNVFNNRMKVMYKRYDYLAKTRSAIMKIEELDFLTDEEKQGYVAQVKCLRAWAAITLYDYFGTVPIATDEMILNPQTFYYPPRATEDEYEEMVASELEYAIEYLPHVAAETGRVSKGAARMMLLKFYMMKKDFTKALAVARDLKDMEAAGYYALEENYFDIWGTEKEDNKEFILVSNAISSELTLSNRLSIYMGHTYFPIMNAKTTNAYGYRLDWDFLDSFEEGDMRVDPVDTYDLWNAWANGVALPSGMICTGYYNKSTMSSTDSTAGSKFVGRDPDTGELTSETIYQSMLHGAYIMKYYNDPGTLLTGNGCDRCIYRFADVYLSLAECINETNNGPTTEAIALVNAIRSRAKISDLSSSDTASYDAFKAAIFREREWELYFEDHSRTDLIRQGTWVDVMKAKAEKFGFESYAADYKTVFAIPEDYIIESLGAVVQNPGY